MAMNKPVVPMSTAGLRILSVPGTVVAGSTVTVPVIVTNTSVYAGTTEKVPYTVVVRFRFYVKAGATIGQSDAKAYSIWIDAGGQAHVNYTFTVPSAGYTLGYVKVELRNTGDSVFIGTTLQSSDFTITSATITPGATIAF